MGPKWHEIAKLVDNRTEIQVKNRFNCILKKNGETTAATKDEHVAQCLFKVQQKIKENREDASMEDEDNSEV